MHRSGRHAGPDGGLGQASGAPGAPASRPAAPAVGARLRADDDQPFARPRETAGHGRGGGAIAPGAVVSLLNQAIEAVAARVPILAGHPCPGLVTPPPRFTATIDAIG